MGRTVTAKMLEKGSSTEEEVDEAKETTKAEAIPGEDSIDDLFKGESKGVGNFGKDSYDQEVAAAQAHRKQADTDRLEEGKKDEDEDKESTLDAKAAKQIKDAQRKMHEATTKASKLEKLNTDLQKRVDEAAKAAPDTAPAVNPWDAKRQKVADDTITKAAAIQSPVPPQDRDDPEFDAKWAEYQKQMATYNGKVALVWAEAQTEIANLAFEEREEAKKNKEAVVSAVDTALEEAGLITDRTGQKEKDSILRLFWSLSTDVPKSLPMEDQIEETVKLCKEFVDELRGKERDRARDEKKNQEDLSVLGRGSRVINKKEPEASHTMGEAQRTVLERRKLRHSP